MTTTPPPHDGTKDGCLYPHVVVAVPGDVDAGMLRSRIVKALSTAGLAAEADRYLSTTNLLKGSLHAVSSASSDWVTLEFAGAASVGSAASSDPQEVRFVSAAAEAFRRGDTVFEALIPVSVRQREFGMTGFAGQVHDSSPDGAPKWGSAVQDRS